MSKRFYLRHNGALTFWRVGRLCGSFCLARRAPARAQTWRIVAAKRLRGARGASADAAVSYGPTLVRVRSLGDLGGAVIAALYSACMALGAALAAVATFH